MSVNETRYTAPEMPSSPIVSAVSLFSTTIPVFIAPERSLTRTRWPTTCACTWYAVLSKMAATARARARARRVFMEKKRGGGNSCERVCGNIRLCGDSRPRTLRLGQRINSKRIRRVLAAHALQRKRNGAKALSTPCARRSIWPVPPQAGAENHGSHRWRRSRPTSHGLRARTAEGQSDGAPVHHHAMGRRLCLVEARAPEGRRDCFLCPAWSQGQSMDRIVLEALQNGKR